ncbi:hypothetical protein, partial [Methanothrix sp.]
RFHLTAHLSEYLEREGFPFWGGQKRTGVSLNRGVKIESANTFVTPDMAIGIVEVKTQIQGDLKDVLHKLADDVEMIRTNGNQQCMAGLFIYEPYSTNDGPERILRRVREVANGNESRVINWIAAGPNIFVRYWCKGEDVQSNVHGPVWHSYTLDDYLAHAYFLSNIVWDTCSHLDLNMQYAWFPIEGGKENYRRYYVGLNDTQPTRFDF